MTTTSEVFMACLVTLRIMALLVVKHDAGLSDVLHSNSSIEIGTDSIKMPYVKK